MKALVCEMCGSQDLLKQDGMYICQNCGTKYAPEEAKKLLVEVSGSVKIDTSGRIENLYQLARRALEGSNYADAANYYQQISVERPDDWEANFYKVFCQAMTSENRALAGAANTIANNLPSTARLLEQTDLSVIDKASIAERINSHCTSFRLALSQIALDLTKAELYDLGNQVQEAGTYLSFAQACFIEPYNKDTAFTWFSHVAELAKSENLRKAATDKAKSIKPDYVPTPPKSSGGCYVATAVYGSYDCPEVWTLRRYRDYELAETWYGRAFIRTYYAVSPTLVKWFGNTQWFKKMWKPTLDRMIERLNNEGVANTPYQDTQW